MIGLAGLKYIAIVGGTLIGLVAMPFVGKDVVSFVGDASSGVFDDGLVERSFSRFDGVSKREAKALDSLLFLNYPVEVATRQVKSDYRPLIGRYSIDSDSTSYSEEIAKTIYDQSGLGERNFGGFW